jgi:hypothetical protein
VRRPPPQRRVTTAFLEADDDDDDYEESEIDEAAEVRPEPASLCLLPHHEAPAEHAASR